MQTAVLMGVVTNEFGLFTSASSLKMLIFKNVDIQKCCFLVYVVFSCIFFGASNKRSIHGLYNKILHEIN